MYLASIMMKRIFPTCSYEYHISSNVDTYYGVYYISLLPYVLLLQSCCCLLHFSEQV